MCVCVYLKSPTNQLAVLEFQCSPTSLGIFRALEGLLLQVSGCDFRSLTLPAFKKAVLIFDIVHLTSG